MLPTTTNTHNLTAQLQISCSESYTIPGIYYSILGCWRFTTFCWVGEHINIVVKPTNAPTQGQPNPRKIRLKVAFWATFSHSKYFFVGRDWFYIGHRLQDTQPHPTEPNSPQTPCYIMVILWLHIVGVCRLGWRRLATMLYT